MLLTQNAHLAVLLREVQWEIDAMAFDLPAGRCTPERRKQLADMLVTLADVLRPLVVDTQAFPVPSDTRDT